MIELPEEIRGWSWPDTDQVPDGYNLKDQPALTVRNLQFLAGQFNTIVEYLKSKEESNE